MQEGKGYEKVYIINPQGQIVSRVQGHGGVSEKTIFLKMLQNPPPRYFNNGYQIVLTAQEQDELEEDSARRMYGLYQLYGHGMGDP